jgi:anthranilate synthase component 1
VYHPSLEEIIKLKYSGNIAPVYREIVADMETPVSAFLKINRGGVSFLLESVDGRERQARYSFLGTEPGRLLEIPHHDRSDPLVFLRRELAAFKAVQVEGLPRFCGGAVGYLSYETSAAFEDLPSPENDSLCLPEALFMLVDTFLVFDHLTHRIKVVSHVRLDGDIEQSYDEAISRIEELISRLSRPLPESPGSAGHSHYSEPVSNYSRSDFEASVLKIKEYITAGEAIQVVLSQRLAQPTTASPFAIYRALRSINPSPYMFFLDFKDFHIIGASPETLVRVEDGAVMTRPLAGTRRRGVNAAEDNRLSEELLGDEKERAEHIMLVDLGRNDIGRVSEPGSVEVSDLMNIERYSHVMHLVTHVQGRLRAGKDCFDALRACFPAGTVSGAPKIRAMQIIAELEPDKRGPYAGAAGYFSFSGNMDMAISIRTMVMANGIAYTQAGCGVVYDSVPSLEYEETLNKARALLGAIRQAEGAPLEGERRAAVNR